METTTSSTTDKDTAAAYEKLLSYFKREMHLKYAEHNVKAMPEDYTPQEANHVTLIYFVLGAISLLKPEAAKAHFSQYVDPAALVDYIYSLQVLPTHPGGAPERCGFQGTQEGLSAESPYQMASIANTYAALCVLRMLGDDYGRVDRGALIAALRTNQKPDGVFPNAPLVPGVHGDATEGLCAWEETGECDLRFVFTACAISAMIGDWSGVDRERAIEYVLRCRGFEGGGFAQSPGCESHGGSTYCAVNALALMGALDRIPNKDRLVRWLLARQVSGFQGRINKDPDSCYSFWIGASLKTLGAFDLIDKPTLVNFILSCQTKYGGFSKTPDAYPDVLHTYMALCGLSFVNQIIYMCVPVSLVPIYIYIYLFLV